MSAGGVDMSSRAVGFKGVMVVVLAAAASMAPASPASVERFYSTTSYSILQAWLTRLSNLTALAMFDVLLIAVLGSWLLLAVRDLAGGRRGWLRTLAGIAGRTLVWAAALYLVFLCTWGLNYRRAPLAERLAFD